MNRWLLVIRSLSRSLGFRAGLFGVLGVLAILAALLLDPVVPRDLSERFGRESALVGLLTILASSLLAVATFSLGAMVTAYTALSTGATPRTAGLVTSNDQTQTSLSTFVGGFLYAIVGLAALGPGLLGAGGRTVLFFTTLLIIGVVAWTLVRWIALLRKIARVTHAVAEVERITTGQILVEARAPHRGGLAELPGYADGLAADELRAERSTFVRNVDLEAAQEIAEELDCVVELLVLPARFTLRTEPILRAYGARAAEAVTRLSSCITTSDARSFDGDPRHGLVVLGEIGAKAMSPSINDPGTAIAAVQAALRIIECWQQELAGPPEVKFDRVVVGALQAGDLIDDAFLPIMRYGAGDLAVSMQVQTALASLAKTPGSLGVAAAAIRENALERSRAELQHPDDVRRVEAAGSR